MGTYDYNLQLRSQELHLGGQESSGDIKTVIAYPNRYWLAMSNLGYQAVYQLFATHPRFDVERAYLPETEAETPKTFEKKAPLSNSQLLAISVSFETDYPNVLRLIAAAGRNLESCRELKDNTVGNPEDKHYFRPFILGGGAALTLNPEPLANFFDAIVIGEGEELVPEIASLFSQAYDDNLPRAELLQELAKLEGVYIPSLFSVSYNKSGTISSFQAEQGVAKVRRRLVENLDLYPTRTIIQTPNTEFKSMFMTETGRGCEVGCKFCVAGYMYRPVRKRSAEVIAETVQLGLENGDSIGFVGAAVSSHPKIAELTSSVAQQGGRAALSSIMTQKVTPKLAGSLSESEYKTVALAPEAGSERLRFSIGKRVCDEQILNGISELAAAGIRNFKLYFIVGLPTETEADVQAIGHLLKLARERAFAAARSQGTLKIAPNLLLSVNPFIPKAWTPFQRHGFMGFKEINRRLSLVRKIVAKLPNVEMKNESPRESYFQAVLSRGDRRVGDLLLHLHQQELDWRWLVKNGAQEIIQGIPAPEFYVTRNIDSQEVLPWEIVDLRIKRSLLERLYQSTFDDDVQPLIERARAELSRSSQANCLEVNGSGSEPAKLLGDLVTRDSQSADICL